MAKMHNLVSLPPEIRNHIYEFALTPKRGALGHVEVRTSAGTTSFLCETGHAESTLGSEFNQLKYVNRQLYSETATMELKYSGNLVFHDVYSPLRPSGAQAVRFLSSLPPKKCTWLRMITIKATVSANRFIRDSATTLSRLDQFCSQYSNLGVAYELPSWTFDPTEGQYAVSLYQGLFYSVLLRQENVNNSALSVFINPLMASPNGDLPDQNVPDGGSPLIRTAREWRDNETLSFKSKNLRFFPVVRDEDGRRSRNVAGLAAAFSSWLPVMAQAARVKIEGWSKNGL